MSKIIVVLICSAAILFAVWGLLQKTPDRIIPEGASFYNMDTNLGVFCFYQETLYAGGINGLYRFDGQKFVLLDNPAVTFVRALAVHDETLWVGSEQGLYRGDGASFELILPERVQCLAVDGASLWVGTLEGGVRLPDGLRLHKSDGLTSDYVNVILPLGDGVLFGSYLNSKGGVALWYGGEITAVINMAQGLPHPYVTSLIYIGEGSVWVGTGYIDKGGACLLSVADGRLEMSDTLLKENGLTGEKVRSLYVDMYGGLWFGSESDGIAIFRDRTVVSLLTQDDWLPNNEALCFQEDGYGGIWIGTPEGVAYLDTEAVRRISVGEIY